MAGQDRKMTEAKFKRYLKEGRGQGEGSKYVPWIKIGEIPSSNGRQHRIKDPFNGRTHHLLSDLEAYYYYKCIWSDRVIDYRDQFPLLPRRETENIADRLGIKHPDDGGHFFVMTTDALLTIRDEAGEHTEARHMKYKEDFDDERVREKEQIEREFWLQKGIGYKVVTEDSISIDQSKNIALILAHYEQPQIPGVNEEAIVGILNEVLYSIQEYQSYSLKELGGYIDRIYGLPLGSGLNVFFFLAAHKVFKVKLDKPIIGTNRLEDVIDFSTFHPNTISEEVLLYESHAE